MKTTIISEDIEFQGTIQYNSNLTIKGNVIGKIKSEGYLRIESNAFINADIEVKKVEVSGKIQGNITQSDLIIVHKESSIYGDIESKEGEIHKGAKIQGNISIQ